MDSVDSVTAALDLVPEAVVLLGPDREVLATNDRVRRVLDLRGDAIGQKFGDVVTLLDDSGHVCSDPVPQRRGVADRIAETMFTLRTSNGRQRPVAMAGRWLDDGRVTLSFRSAGRRQQLDAARSDLVATVSHEIRSPLTSVKGFTRTMLLKWDRYSDEQKLTFLETINEDADRVTRLLKELLDVSRIDANRVELHIMGMDVAQLAQDVVDKAMQRPDGEGREVRVVVAEDVPRLLYADKDKIEQVLTNLLNNALRYAPDSPVTIDVARGDDDGAVVTVVDEGPGIPGDQQRSIFRKFGRGRESRRAGTGLGLYITRGLAQAHGGDVVLDSTLGEGATFTLRLPPGQAPG